MLVHVAVAVAGELDDPPPLVLVGRVVAHGARGGHVQDVPAGVAEALAEVHLVREDEERGVQVPDRLGGVAAHQQGGRLHPVDVAHLAAAALHDEAAVQPENGQQRRQRPGEPPCGGLLLAGVRDQRGARHRRLGPRVERLVQRHRRTRLELGVLVEQEHVAPARPPQQRRVVLALAAALLERDHLGRAAVGARGAGGAVARGVVEHDHLRLERHRGALTGDRVQAVAQELTLLRVDHAIRELDRHGQSQLPVVRPVTPPTDRRSSWAARGRDPAGAGAARPCPRTRRAARRRGMARCPDGPGSRSFGAEAPRRPSRA